MDTTQNTNENPQLIFSWKAPLRPYKKRSSVVLRFYLAVALLLCLIVFFFGDKILLVPILSLLFLFYVLTVTPPPEVENKITRFGIDAAGVTLRWEALSHFYYKTRFGFTVLAVVSHAPYFYHAFIVVPDEQTKNHLTLLLSEHLIYEEKPEHSFTDRASDWFSGLIPDEEDHPVLTTKQPATTLSPQTPAPI